eukprot:234567_1
MSNFVALLIMTISMLNLTYTTNEYRVINDKWNTTTVSNEINDDKIYSAIITINGADKINTFSNYTLVLNEYLNSLNNYYITFQLKQENHINILLSTITDNFNFSNIFIIQHTSRTISVLTNNCVQKKLVRFYGGFEFKNKCVQQGNKPNNYRKSRRNLLVFYDSWVTSNLILPRGGDANMAIGYFNDSIFLLGGNAYGYQMLEYKVFEKEFIDHGELAISDNTFGFGQYYTQINDTIYIIDPDGDKLSVFHMNTKIFEKSWNSVVIPLDVSSVGVGNVTAALCNNSLVPCRATFRDEVKVHNLQH